MPTLAFLRTFSFSRLFRTILILILCAPVALAETAEADEEFKETLPPPNLSWGVSPIEFTLKFRSARSREEEDRYDVSIPFTIEERTPDFLPENSLNLSKFWDVEYLRSPETRWVVGWWSDTHQRWKYVQQVPVPRASSVDLSLPLEAGRGRPFIFLVAGEKPIEPRIPDDAFSPALTLLQNCADPSPEVIQEEDPDEPLWLEFAAAIGRVDWIDQFESLNERLQRKIRRHSEALVAAGKAGQVEAVAALLRHGFEPDETDAYGLNAAHHAAMNGFPEVIEAMLDSGDFKLTKHSAADVFDPLGLAVDFNQDRVVPLLTAHGLRLPRLSQIRKKRLLAYHAHLGNAEIVDYLLSEDPEIDEENAFDSLLNAAVYGGKAHIVSRFLDAGADPNPTSGLPPLSLACSRNMLDIVELLLAAGADPNNGGEEAMPPLVFAVINGDASIVKKLLEKGADPQLADPAKAPAGMGVVEWATMLGNQEMVDALFAANAKCHFSREKAEDVLLFAIGGDIAETAILAGESCLTPDFRFYGEYSLGWVAQRFEASSILTWLQQSDWKDFAPPTNLVPINETTQRPNPLEIPLPRYEPEMEEVWGRPSIRVRFVIDEEGRARLPEFIGDRLPPKYQLALFEAVKLWRFAPAEVDGQRVKTIVYVPLELSAPDDVMDLTNVTTPPKPISQPPPVYPRQLQREHVEGIARLSFVVRKSGEVSQVETLFASHPALAVVASQAVANWTFEPAEKDGVPVDCRVKITIPFRIR
jgi:hypothetical protein